MTPTALAMVLKWLVAYNYRRLVSPPPLQSFFFLNVAASLVGGGEVCDFPFICGGESIWP